MLPFTKILCPTDFSEPSYVALERANEMALHFSSELVLVHVVAPIPILPTPEGAAGFNVTSYQQEMETQAVKSLNLVAKEKITADVKLETLVVQGDPTDEIVRVAADRHTDLIVIATHGLKGWRRLVFGSIAAKVLRLAPCPVLSIHLSPEKK